MFEGRRGTATIAIAAAVIWFISTMANLSNSWDPLNFSIRVVAGFVAVVAGARWVTLRGSHDDQNAKNGASQVTAVGRSAGSRTMLDNVRSVFGHRHTPAQDLATVSGGGAVLVVAYVMEEKVRRVSLRVGLDEVSVEALAVVLGPAPHQVFGVQVPTRGLFEKSLFTQINGASASGEWSIAVPTADLETVRYVLQRARKS